MKRGGREVENQQGGERKKQKVKEVHEGEMKREIKGELNDKKKKKKQKRKEKEMRS